MKDALWKRTEATEKQRHGRPGRGWWRWNIRNPYSYARSMIKQVERQERRLLSPSRLKVAIEEDSGQTISVADCRAILRKIGYKKR